MNQMIPSFVFKHRAWAAIKPWLQVLIVIGLLAVLPGLVNDTASNLLSDDMSDALSGPAKDVMEFTMQTLPEDISDEELQALVEQANALSETFVEQAVSFFREKGWILLLVGGLELLLTPMLTAPLYGALLDAYRKKELTIPGCLRYLRLAPKALLLMLWMTIRINVWMLPGMAAMILAFFVPLGSSLLLWAGFIASLVLGIRAALHYCLAPIVLMDQPEQSVNGCIRRSWEVMRNRKMEYFMLRISFIFWTLLVDLVMMLAVNPVMMAICLTVKMMANLLLTIYINGSVVVFWDTYGVRGERRGASVEMDPQPDVPGDDLN